MVKAVTFDLWGTLLCDMHYGDYRIGVLAQIFEEGGFSMDHHTIRNAYQSAVNHFNDLWKRDRRYQVISATKAVEFILRNLNIKLSTGSKSTAIKRFEEAALNDPPQLTNNAWIVLKTLHNNYRIGLVSNTGVTPGRILRKVLEHNRILQYFGCTIFSDEVGYTKPYPAIFRRAIEKLQVDPNEAIHIGDILNIDIAGARSVGMKTIWLNKTGDSIQKNKTKFIPDYEIKNLSELLGILA